MEEKKEFESFRVSRNTTPFINLSIVSSLLFVLVGVITFANTDNAGWLSLIALAFIMDIWMIYKVWASKKEYLMIEKDRVIAHTRNGETKEVKFIDVYEVMCTNNRLTEDNKINKNYLYLELRDKKHNKLMLITKSSFNLVEINRFVEHLIEVRNVVVVDK